MSFHLWLKQTSYITNKPEFKNYTYLLTMKLYVQGVLIKSDDTFKLEIIKIKEINCNFFNIIRQQKRKRKRHSPKIIIRFDWDTLYKHQPLTVTGSPKTLDKKPLKDYYSHAWFFLSCSCKVDENNIGIPRV